MNLIQADGSSHASDGIPPYPAAGLAEAEHLLRYNDPNGKYYIFYRERPARKGGPGLVVARRSATGFEKIVSDYFPLTEEGWRSVWEALAAIDPQEFERCRKSVARNEVKHRLHLKAARLREEIERNTRILLDDSVFLGGYTPSATLKTGSAYDLRFMNDSLAVFDAENPQPLASLNYISFTNIQITGPGVAQSANPFADSAGRVIGTAIRVTQSVINENILNAAGSIISAGLRAAGDRAASKTVLAIRTTDSELFFLYPRTDPRQLRIDLSPILGRIREVLGSAATGDNKVDPSPDATSIINQLKDASMLLDRGLLTRDEFDRLKSRLLAGD